MVERLFKVSESSGRTPLDLANAAAGYHYTSLAAAVDERLPFLNRAARRLPAISVLASLEFRRKVEKSLQQLDTLFAD
jgi:hypothetical protein